MVSNKFQDIHQESYVLNVLARLSESDVTYNEDDEKALRILIDLTDELRRNKKYTPEFRELIFGEVDKRVDNNKVQ